LYCGCKNKKNKKGKEKKDKTMIEKEICVFVYFFFMYVIESKKKMNLVF